MELIASWNTDPRLDNRVETLVIPFTKSNVNSTKNRLDDELSVYNVNTPEYTSAGIDEILSEVDFSTILEKLQSVPVNERGNHQICVGSACSKSCADRSDHPSEYCLALPAVLTGTNNTQAFVPVYKAMSNLARRVGVAYALEAWPTLSLENKWRHWKNQTKYFTSYPACVFEGFTIAWICLNSGKPLLVHTDAQNCTVNREILVVSRLIQGDDGLVYRVTFIG